MAGGAEPDNVKGRRADVTPMMVRLYYCVAPAMLGQLGIVPLASGAVVRTGKRASPECPVNFGVCPDLGNVGCRHIKTPVAALADG